MVTFKVLVTICNVLIAMLMFLLQRNQKDRITILGFWVLILLYIANAFLVWN